MGNRGRIYVCRMIADEVLINILREILIARNAQMNLYVTLKIIIIDKNVYESAPWDLQGI